MAKSKNKRKNLSDKLHNKIKKTITKPKSPFEIHIDNEKLKVLNRRNKHNKSLPGESRSKAVDKRKQTLLEEYKTRNKSNKFMDKRIGANNKVFSTEDTQIARFAAVRANTHKKKSVFNLGDDEVLTHKGQSLSEIELFDDPRSEDEDYDEDTGKLDDNFVEKAHFGGGLLKETGKEGARTHRDLIGQLIAESKKRKAEKQKIREATIELTQKLDTDWRDLLPLVNNSTQKTDQVIDKPKVDDYDKIMRQLKFEPRGIVSDRLKSEEEIVKEEKEKLEKLENERLLRMKGVTEDQPKVYTHRSADDLDDGFIYEPENDLTLSYDNEGQSNIPIEENANKDEYKSEKSDGEDESDSEESDGESEDNLSDLKLESSCSENEDENSKKEMELDEKSKIKEDLLKRKEVMDKARDEVPYTFSLPESYEALQTTLSNYSYIQQGLVIERMIKCNHSSLAKGNKDNLSVLFAFILQYINDIASESVDDASIKYCFNIFQSLAPHLFNLSQMNQVSCHNAMVEIIKEKFQEYWKKPKEFPGLEVLLFFKVVSLLFTTSDFRHQVVTPCLIFMEKMLTTCRVSTKRHISYGIFLSTLVLEYTTLSKRFMPGCINFLSGIIHMAVPKSTVRIVKVLPPFHSTSSELVLLEDQLSFHEPLKMEILDLLNNKITESFKLRAFYTALKLSNEFYENLKECSSIIEIFEPIYTYCKLIKPNSYPKIIQNTLIAFNNQFEENREHRVLKYIVMAAKKPKALRLYEPKIVEVYDGKKHKVQSKEKAERDKLVHKIKRERKGALREIRRDNAFLGRIKIKQQIKSDKERREKVKRIFAEASIQQSELNELDRKKKKK